MFQKFRPLGDRVLIKRLEGEEKTASGIIIPDAAKRGTDLQKRGTDLHAFDGVTVPTVTGYPRLSYYHSYCRYEHRQFIEATP